MPQYKSPQDRLGVFKALPDVPDSRRFHQYARTYSERDTWGAYRATVSLSDTMSEEWQRFIRRWKTHMDEQGRHHALATPADVEAWSVALLGRFGVDRSYQHWNVIEGFYDWLKWHTDHPHAYNPFHMAANDLDSAAREIWSYKMKKAND